MYVFVFWLGSVDWVAAYCEMAVHSAQCMFSWREFLTVNLFFFSHLRFLIGALLIPFYFFIFFFFFFFFFFFYIYIYI